MSNQICEKYVINTEIQAKNNGFVRKSHKQAEIGNSSMAL